MAGPVKRCVSDQAVPGHSFHREIELYVEAGFTPMEAIQVAAIVPSWVSTRNWVASRRANALT